MAVVHRRVLLASAGLAGVLVVAMWIAAKSGVHWPWPLDVRGDPARRGLSTGPKVVLAVVAVVGNPVVAGLTVLALARVAARQGGARLALLVPASAAVVVVTTAAKRLGPDVSLPSGHAAYAIAVLGMGAWLCAREGRRTAAALMGALALVMGPCRVIDGAHYVVDVVAGDALGMAWLVAVLVLGVPRPVPAAA